VKVLFLFMFGCSVGYFTDVTADFQSKMPVISTVAHYDAESYRLQIVVSNAECVQTSRLLSVYSQLDPRVRPIAITFLYWAKVSTVMLLCIHVLTGSMRAVQVLVFNFLTGTFWGFSSLHGWHAALVWRSWRLMVHPIDAEMGRGAHKLKILCIFAI